MYDIDFQTCSVRDVIARSVTCHPSLMIELLTRAGNSHVEASETVLDEDTRRTYNDMHTACTWAAKWVYTEDLEALCRDLEARGAAFLIACRLQCVPRAAWHDIAKRDAS